MSGAKRDSTADMTLDYQLTACRYFKEYWEATLLLSDFSEYLVI